MATAVEPINVDTAFDLLDRRDVKSFKWTVTLGDPEWAKDVLLLLLYEEDDDKEMVWIRYGRIDAVRRSVTNLTRSVEFLTSWTESTDVWELDPKKFVGSEAKCFVRSDIDDVVKTLRSTAAKKDWATVNF